MHARASDGPPDRAVIAHKPEDSRCAAAAYMRLSHSLSIRGACGVTGVSADQHIVIQAQAAIL
jgi:hypothetical protein